VEAWKARRNVLYGDEQDGVEALPRLRRLCGKRRVKREIDLPALGSDGIHERLACQRVHVVGVKMPLSPSILVKNPAVCYCSGSK
jgi:hypothetical protein